jgi:hypothetical protein
MMDVVLRTSQLQRADRILIDGEWLEVDVVQTGPNATMYVRTTGERFTLELAGGTTVSVAGGRCFHFHRFTQLRARRPPFGGDDVVTVAGRPVDPESEDLRRMGAA